MNQRSLESSPKPKELRAEAGMKNREAVRDPGALFKKEGNRGTIKRW